jgi:hypothetical protein
MEVRVLFLFLFCAKIKNNVANLNVRSKVDANTHIDGSVNYFNFISIIG